MNLIDAASMAVMLLFLLSGVYKGLLHTLMSIGSFILSVLLAFLIRPIGVSLITGNETLFNMMLYYTEGSEFIASPEYVRLDIAQMSSSEIADIIAKGNLPYPMGREISENIASEAFKASGITTLGDYFNQTIVLCFINIVAFLVSFIIVKLIFSLVINGVDYAHPFPVLRSLDPVFGGVAGLVNGGFALLLIFMLVPVALTVFGQFDLITDMVEGSRFAEVFYRMNFLLSLVV